MIATTEENRGQERESVAYDVAAVTAALRAVDRDTLTPLVRQALDSRDAQVVSWHAPPLTYDATNPVSLGVYRFSGMAHEGDRMRPWSLVLKMVRSPVGVEVAPGFVIPPEADTLPPSHFGYWKREIAAYRTGILERLPGGMAAPRCFDIVQVRPRVFWLWLEDVAEDAKVSWTPSRYRTAARDLGRFNGAYLAGEPLPTAPWFAAGWLRSYMQEGPGNVLSLASATHWQHPLVRRFFPPAMVRRLMRLHQDRDLLLDLLDQLPQALSHRDAFPPNLFLRKGADGREQTVAIDWAFTGIGPVGEEMAPLVTVHPVGAEGRPDARKVKETVLDGYIEGLTDAGWNGDERTVRFGLAATAALRYGPITAGEAAMNAMDTSRYAAVEQRRGRPIETVIEEQAQTVAFLLDLADEARCLIPSIAPPRAA